jgi:hypothetical protein
VDEFQRFLEAAKRGDVDTVRALLSQDEGLARREDARGATALHHAAFGGHRAVVQLLVERGANVNARDGKFGATPAGWAIEYLRELGGFPGNELADFAHAIRRGDLYWVQRWLERFPNLRHAADHDGVPFSRLAAECGNAEIAALFR